MELVVSIRVFWAETEGDGEEKENTVVLSVLGPAPLPVLRRRLNPLTLTLRTDGGVYCEPMVFNGQSGTPTGVQRRKKM